MPLFTLSFRKPFNKSILVKDIPVVPVDIPVVIEAPRIKKEDIKPKLKKIIKVKNDSKVKLKSLIKKTKEIHLSENEDSE
jgi:hypothetical protein